ncbi:MAG: orotidine-5'-phosphate decarboxylase [Candidatus Gracilibacteria bacterium]|nr:orotidine-5'-phosphate decarboxylase [Candidatus Gracilibacteria bacterium]
MEKPDRRRIIVALDVPNQRAAIKLAKSLAPSICRVKVGMELFVAAGPSVVKALQRLGFEVFLDLKFKDIPNTVAGAVRAACRMGVWMCNVHADGGSKMMRFAAGAAQQDLLVTGVTVLTSMDEDNLSAIGVHLTPKNQVMRLAKLAMGSHLHGVVCSGLEVADLRAQLGPDFILVTPGIRLPDGNKDDQIRIVTPEMAIESGADYIVVGRPITEATCPGSALLDFDRRVLSALGGFRDGDILNRQSCQ